MLQKSKRVGFPVNGRVGIGRPEQSCRAHRRSLRGGVGLRAIVDVWAAGPGAEERGREGKGDDTKAPSVEAHRVWPVRHEAGVSPDGERWGAGKVEPWSSGVREEKPRLTA